MKKSRSAKDASNQAGKQDLAALLKRFKTGDLLIGVVGLGYVGIPLSVTAVRAGMRVLGFDIDSPRVASLNRGESFIRHIPSSEIADARKNSRFEATDNFDRLKEPDAILIAVPTPLSPQREPDLKYVEQTSEAIAKRLRPGQLIVLESTTYPGTTQDVMQPILEKSGLKAGIDFFLAYSPEREDPGNASFSTSRIPKVVGGDGAMAKALAVALYSRIIEKVVPVSDTATAEAVKLTENIFRAVNIALVNELKTVFGAMDIDVWEVIGAASTKPFGYMPFYPGPGLGGHCIPIDPFYLTWKAREFDTTTQFIELAGLINTRMPYLVIDKLAEALGERRGKPLKGARILVLGAAYKKNIDDLRESPSLKLMSILKSRGASVSYHDPYIPEIGTTREHPELSGMKSRPLTAKQLGQSDAVLISTDHDNLDYALIAKSAPLVVDTRNAMEKARVSMRNVIKA